LYDPDLKSVCDVTDEGSGTLEIQNLATDERYQRRGYASKLLNHIFNHYRNRYGRIILGTGDAPGILSFYARFGFAIIGREPDYFTKLFDYPIYEDGVMLRDRVLLEKVLHPMAFRIETERLVITEFDEGMAESVHENSLDDDIRRFVPDEVFETVEDARRTILSLMACYNDNDEPFVYPILLRSGENIGYVQAIPIRNGWEIGYHVVKKHTGNGYATEAVTAFLPIIMKRLGIDRISGLCAVENTASCRVLEKCGFRLEYKGSGNYQGSAREVCRYLYRNL